MSKKYFQELISTTVPDLRAAPRSSRFRNTNEVTTVAWNNPSTRIAYGRTDRSLRVWKLKFCDIVGNLPVIMDNCHEKDIESISWKPTSESTIATVGNDSKVKIWNTDRGLLQKEIDVGVSGLLVVKYSGDANFIAAISKYNVLTIIDAASYEIVDTIKLDIDMYSITWNNTSSFLFLGLTDGTIPMYSFKDKKLNHIHTLKGHRSAIKDLKIEARARYLVAGSNEGIISLWSLQTLAVVKVFGEIDQPIHQVDVSRDGTYIAATYEGGEPAKIYEIDSHQCFHQLPKCVPGSITFPKFVFCPIKTIFAYSTVDGDVVMTNKPPASNRTKYVDRN